MSQDKTSSAGSLQLLKVLAMAEGATQIVLGGMVASGILDASRTPAEEVDSLVVTAVLGMGALTLIASPFLGGVVARVSRRGPVEDRASAGQAEIAGRIVRVITAGMAGIFGFVGYLLGGSMLWAGLLAVGALLTIALCWPKAD